MPRGGQGKMCGSISGRNPLSSCKGPRLEDDVESFIVMPGERNVEEILCKYKVQ